MEFLTMNNFGKTNQISIGSNLFLLFDKFQQIFKLNEIEKKSQWKKNFDVKKNIPGKKYKPAKFMVITIPHKITVNKKYVQQEFYMFYKKVVNYD